jgi:hypothetical protein
METGLLTNLQSEARFQVRSYWLAIHESLRDVARVRAAADWLTDAVPQEAPAFEGNQG